MTHTDLAEKSGLTPSYILQIERGDTRPGLKAIDKIADVLGVNGVTLIEGATPFTSDPFLDQIIDLMLNDGAITLHIGDKKFDVPDHVKRSVVGIVMAASLRENG